MTRATDAERVQPRLTLGVAYRRFAPRVLVGIALLGMSEDREAAQLRGVNVRRFAFLAFVFTGLLAGMVGVLVGGAVVGLVESFTARYLGGDYANIGVFVILILILMVKPTGLFTRSRERVV